MTVHNEANKGDFAKTVLMPGDPLRAKMIAERYLEDYKLVNNVRGMYAYTGFYNGVKVSVMASGMGMPSIGIYSYELYKFYDVEHIIRIGSCGSIDTNLNLYDIFVAKDAYAISTYGKCFNIEENILPSDTSLSKLLQDTAFNMNKKIAYGRAFSSDTFYADTDIEHLHNEMGCHVVEMEAYALFCNAKILNKKAAAIFTVSDSIITKEETTPEERQNSFNDMIVVALEAAIRL